MTLVRTDVSERRTVKIFSELETLSVTMPVTANVVPSSLIFFALMTKVIFSSETLVPTRSTRRHISEDGNLHSHCRENPKSYIALTGWALRWRRNLASLRYELGFYIPEDDILHSHCLENPKSYIALTGWALQWRRNVSSLRYELGFFIPEGGLLHSHCRENHKSHIALTGWAM
jgi:hypothetical protein